MKNGELPTHLPARNNQSLKLDENDLCLHEQNIRILF